MATLDETQEPMGVSVADSAASGPEEFVRVLVTRDPARGARFPASLLVALNRPDPKRSVFLQ